jgi:hypothetical protein
MSAKGPTIYQGVDTIRQVQELLVFASLLPVDGKLREALNLALDLPPETVQKRVGSLDDVHPHTVKGWLERIWLAEDLTPAERRIVNFQSDSDSMAAAVQELREVQQITGMQLTASKI